LFLLGGSAGKVVGPVSASVGDPADGGVEVKAEEASEDLGGQVGGEGSECSVAGGPGADAVAVELSGEAGEVEGPAGDAAWEQPADVWSVGDHEAGRRLGGQFADKGTEPGREQDRVATSGQIGVSALLRGRFVS
jgi:hypothetical protein